MKKMEMEKVCREMVELVRSTVNLSEVSIFGYE